MLNEGFTSIARAVKEKEVTVPIVIRLALVSELVILYSIYNSLGDITLILIKGILRRYRLD